MNSELKSDSSSLGIVVLVYVLLGVAYAFIALFADKKQGKTDPTAGISDPVGFWLYIAFWPIAALFRLVGAPDRNPPSYRKDETKKPGD